MDCLTFLMDRGNLALLEEGKLTPTLGSLTVGVKWFLTGSNKKEWQALCRSTTVSETVPVRISARDQGCRTNTQQTPPQPQLGIRALCNLVREERCSLSLKPGLNSPHFASTLFIKSSFSEPRALWSSGSTISYAGKTWCSLICKTQPRVAKWQIPQALIHN